MKVLIDTNILFSAILFENSRVAKVLFYANDHHEIFLSDQNISELRRIIANKIPRKSADMENLLARLSYEVIPAVYNVNIDGRLIRDAGDQPILNAAIVNGIDIIITGDKDFLALDSDKPRCMTVAEFCELEGIE